MGRIKQFVKEFIGILFRFSGIPYLIREVFCRNKVTVIFYHDPSPEIFKKHMEYLSKQYIFIPLQRLINALYEKDWKNIPAKALIVTLDDGHKGNYELLELFKEYNVCPTIYICSDIVNTNRKFWWKTISDGCEKLKHSNNNERLKLLKDNGGFEPTKEYSERQSLSIEEVREMSQCVDFQSHSRYHPILPKCSDEECMDEISGSKESLKTLLNKEIKHFAYPNGDYAKREVNFLKKSGFKSARTIDVGWNDENTNPFKLKAMGVQDEVSINILCAQIAGFFGYL